MSGQWIFVTIPTIEYEKLLKEKAESKNSESSDIFTYGGISAPKPPERRKRDSGDPDKRAEKKLGKLPKGSQNSDRTSLLLEEQQSNGIVNAAFVNDEQGVDEHNEENANEKNINGRLSSTVSDDVYEEVTLRPQGKRRFTGASKGSNKREMFSRISCDEGLSMEQILEKVLEKVNIKSAAWNKTRDFNYWQVCFCVPSGKKSDWVLRVLNSNGINKMSGSSVSVIPTSIFFKSPQDDEKEDYKLMDEEEKERSQTSKWELKRQQFLKTVRARLTVAQVVDGVRRNATLTFDYLMLIILASIIAALGLAENSSVILVASMLISPLMGPILAGVFGIVINDRKLTRQGIKNELIGLGVCILCGFIFGLIFGAAGNTWGSEYWPTEEMASRGRPRALWVGLLIALPSGAGVALSVLGGNAGSLVGVAISASLLPPAVNAGLLWAVSLIKAGENGDVEEFYPNYVSSYSANMAVEVAILGVISLTLTLLNILCIFFTGIVVLKVKEVTPGTSTSTMQRFWKQDLRIAREFNRSCLGQDYNHGALEDLAALAEKEAPLGAQHEVKSFVEGLQEDKTFRNVRAYSMYPINQNLLPPTTTTWHINNDKKHHDDSLLRSRKFSNVFNLNVPDCDVTIRKFAISERNSVQSSTSEVQARRPSVPSRKNSAPETELTSVVTTNELQTST